MAETIILFLLFALNGFFAMCEIALISSRRSKLEHAASKGSRGAKISLHLLQEPEKFLSTVQIGITLVGIVAGALGAEAFTKYLQPAVENIPFLKPVAQEVAFSIIVLSITYFSLVIGELVPKTIALNNPEKITIALAPFMRVLALITYPLVAFLSFSTRVFLKILFIKENKEPPLTEEELKYMIETGSRHGIIQKGESRIMNEVFNFGDKKAGQVMTKRDNIIWIDIGKDKATLLAQVLESANTKFPVCRGSLDKIIGVVSATNLFRYATSSDQDLEKYLLKPVFYPEDTAALYILDDFRKNKTHIGFVANEGGNTLGLITLHDLVEHIIGELPELENIIEVELILRPDGSMLADGAISMKKLISTLKPQGALGHVETETLHEFALHHLPVAPKTGSVFEIGNYRFEIVDMDGARIDKVLISKKTKA